MELTAGPTVKTPGVYSKPEPGEFRVLRVLPGTFGDPLRAILEVRELDNASSGPSYQAISYAWGKPIFTHRINFLDGNSVKITPSLHTALQHLRKQHKATRLWADGVCINQVDTAERSTQVARMYDVYALARNVIVWLGDSVASDAIAFATIEAAAKAEEAFRSSSVQLMSRFLDGWRAMQQVHQSQPCIHCNGLVSATCFASQVDTLINVLTCEWFSRLWVCLEVQAASSVTVRRGRSQASWDSVEAAINFIFTATVLEKTLKEHLPVHAFEQITWSLVDFTTVRPRIGEPPIYQSKDGRRGSCLMRMVHLVGRQCTKAHDRVFAILQLIEPGRIMLTPDYTMPVEQMYANFTIAVLCDLKRDVQHGDERIPGIHPSALIAIAAKGRKVIAGLPSWTPDYQHLDEKSTSGNKCYHPYNGDRNFKNSCPRFRLRYAETTWQKLTIKGRCFATVTDIFAHTQYPLPRLEQTVTDVEYKRPPMLQYLVRWYFACRGHYRDFEGPSQDTSGFETLLYRSKKVTCELGIDPTISAEDFTREVNLTSAGAPSLLGGLSSEDLEKMYEQLCYLLSDHWFRLRMPNESVLCKVTTPYGQKLAWIPGTSQVGDDLAFLGGAPLPFVLRNAHKRDDQTAQQVIGDAWILGIKEWQAMGMTEQSSRILGSRTMDWLANDWMAQYRGTDFLEGEPEIALRWHFNGICSYDRPGALSLADKQAMESRDKCWYVELMRDVEAFGDEMLMQWRRKTWAGLPWFERGCRLVVDIPYRSAITVHETLQSPQDSPLRSNLVARDLSWRNSATSMLTKQDLAVSIEEAAEGTIASTGERRMRLERGHEAFKGLRL